MNNIKLRIVIISITSLIVVATLTYYFWPSQHSDTGIANVSFSQAQMPLDKKDDGNVANNSINVALMIAIIALSLTTLISVGISFYLYKWRKILLTNSNMIVPEEWAKTIQDLGKNLNSFGKGVSDHLSHVANETSNNTATMSSMIETYMQLQLALDSKDAEIKRLKTGYDAEIFRKFISRFTRIDQTIDDFILEHGETADLLQLRHLFEDALDECGISKFSPAIGANYRSAKGVADSPKALLTDDPSKEFLITEVIEAGYQLDNGQENNVIIPSKVKIYKLRQEGAS